jgi:hypothetical protein
MKRQQTETRRRAEPERKPAPAPKERAARKPLVGNSQTALTPEELDQMVATQAYLRAEKRGFAPGHELDDWVAAEHEVRESLAGGRSRALQ